MRQFSVDQAIRKCQMQSLPAPANFQVLRPLKSTKALKILNIFFTAQHAQHGQQHYAHSQPKKPRIPTGKDFRLRAKRKHGNSSKGNQQLGHEYQIHFAYKSMAYTLIVKRQTLRLTLHIHVLVGSIIRWSCSCS